MHDAQKATVAEDVFRVCSECGERNAANARKCTICGEDISDVMPSTSTGVDTGRTEATTYVLRSLDNRVSYTLGCESVILGRENELSDYLRSKTYVSRKHCRFTLEDGNIFVEDLGSANATYVNNQRICGKTRLSRGDEVGLGGAVFDGSRQEQAAYFLIG